MQKEAILFSVNEQITQTQIKKLLTIDFNKEKGEKLIIYCKENNIKSCIGKEVFLKKTKNPPYILYYIGNYNILKTKKIIGIVGPRNITPFIQEYLNKFFKIIKDFKDIAIVSGLADGTDVYAHELSIKYNIPTISVLGFGLAKGLNGTTRHLIKKIKENKGLILSEFKLKQPGTNRTFPQRNRIIAGLSDILFVPQAHKNSGTLITIDEAININTNIYSCFSPIDDKLGEGTNELIAKGKINGIFSFDLFIQEIKNKLNISEQNIAKKIDLTNLNRNDKIIIENIQKGNNSLEKISISSGLSIGDILNTISILEIKGILKTEGDIFRII